MASYRFCRPDDIPLIAQAIQLCYLIHFPEKNQSFTVDEFKNGIRELQYWASSCVITLEGTTPIGILVGAKRPAENAIAMIGVHPDHVRKGHGSHMVQSLEQKLRILNPKPISLEIPPNNLGAIAFFTSLGYSANHESEVVLSKKPLT